MQCKKKSWEISSYLINFPSLHFYSFFFILIPKTYKGKENEIAKLTEKHELYNRVSMKEKVCEGKD